MMELIVHPWPGPVPAPRDGVVAISIAVAHDMPRAHQRAAIRHAIADVLAALTGKPAASFGIHSLPGHPLKVVVDGHDSDIGCSFSHEDGCSIAAINLHGAVGVDLMRIYEVFNWQAVARDYLGPEACAALAATPATDSTLAFVLAWTRHEATLKCHGIQLVEWSEDLAVPATVTASTMLPNNLVASLALPLQDQAQ